MKPNLKNHKHFTVGKVNASDFAEIEQIGQLSLPIYYNRDDLYFFNLDPNHILYKISCTDNGIVGFIVGRRLAVNNGQRIHIKSIAVRPNYRRLGIGRGLVDQLKQEFLCRNLTLYVMEDNYSAIKFYAKQGFKATKRLENYYSSLNKSAYLLEWHI